MFWVVMNDVICVIKQSKYMYLSVQHISNHKMEKNQKK